MDIFWVAMSCVQLSYLYIKSIEQVVDKIIQVVEFFILRRVKTSTGDCSII